MTTLHTALPHQPHASTRSTFGRRVTDEEFPEYKRQVLAALRDNDQFNISESDIDQNLCNIITPVKTKYLSRLLTGFKILFQSVSDAWRMANYCSGLDLEKRQKILQFKKIGRLNTPYSDKWIDATREAMERSAQRMTQHYQRLIEKNAYSPNIKMVRDQQIGTAFHAPDDKKWKFMAQLTTTIKNPATQTQPQPNPVTDN